MRVPSKRFLIYIMSFFAAVLIACFLETSLLDRNQPSPPVHPKTIVNRAPTIALIVMDAVRKDYTAVCNDKPQNINTTPNLQSIIQRGTSYCRMIAPGSWTLPVHASIFTGTLPFVHGADFQADGTTIKGVSNDIRINRLQPDLPTLAELMSAHGYQTVLVSGNPLIGSTTGTNRGFQKIWTSTKFPRRDKALISSQVEKAINSLTPSKPLFIVVNVIFAHGPFESPEDNEVLDIFDGLQTSLFAKFVNGTMPEDEQDRFLKKLRSFYRHGVQKADEDLKNLLSHLKKHSWLDGRESILVTSDHGEMLGEHGLLDHGRNVFQENTDVFLVAVGPHFFPGRRVNRLVQSQDIFSTILAIAGAPVPPRKHSFSLLTPPPRSRLAITVSKPDKHWASLSNNRVGVHSYVAVEDENGHRILRSSAQDPLEKIVDQIIGSMTKVTGIPISPGDDTLRSLQAMGYIE